MASIDKFKSKQMNFNAFQWQLFEIDSALILQVFITFTFIKYDFNLFGRSIKMRITNADIWLRRDYCE